MDEELISYLDQKFEHQSRQIREEIKTGVRQTQVLVEELRSDLQGVAEGVANVNEQLDRHIAGADRRHEDDQAANRATFSHQQRRLDDHEERLSELESASA